jgi:sulfite reductase (ferredoxin)
VVSKYARGGLGSQPTCGYFQNLFRKPNYPNYRRRLRIFDRFGERAKRLKARMKFLIKDIGRDEFLRLVDEEKKRCRTNHTK